MSDNGKRGKYALTFNASEKQQGQVGLSFGMWDIDPNEYHFGKEMDNMKRSLDLPAIEFLDKDSVRYQRLTTEPFQNYNGSTVECVEYIHNKKGVYSNIITEFSETEEIKQFLKVTDGKEFLLHKLKSPFDKSIYGVGYIGYGQFRPYDHKVFYDHYHDMMKRAYSEEHHIKQPTYIGVTVDPRWWDYQVFYKWAIDNHYTVPGQIMQLDKDILIKGNRIYGPDTCVFVPSHINSLFTKTDKLRGDTPIGVSIDEWGNYKAHVCRRGIKRDYLGYFKDPIEAFCAYKKAKEGEIKRVADLYKEWIPERLYIAMYNYQVEITD